MEDTPRLSWVNNYLVDLLSQVMFTFLLSIRRTKQVRLWDLLFVSLNVGVTWFHSYICPMSVAAQFQKTKMGTVRMLTTGELKNDFN